MRATVFCAVLLLILVSGPARAEDELAERRQGLIELFDGDGNWRLDAVRDEIVQRRALRGIDGAGQRQRMLDRFDTDGAVIAVLGVAFALLLVARRPSG